MDDPGWTDIYCLILASPPIAGLVAIVLGIKWWAKRSQAIEWVAEQQAIEKENVRAWRQLERRHKWDKDNPYLIEDQEWGDPPF